MPTAVGKAEGARTSPFVEPDFRRIWGASLCSNLAQQVQAVSAAWLMLQLTSDAGMVALVQTATMLPIFLLALPGGAAADMYDKRRFAMAALLWVMAAATILAVLAITGLVTPFILLAGCFFVGCGIAIFFPIWQSSIGEIVTRDQLPSAIALYAVSANAARSVGPAIGGFVVAAMGAAAALVGNVFLYLPMLTALFLWKRRHVPSRLPPEPILRAMASGLHYVRYATGIRTAFLRAFVTAVGTSAVYGLLPVVAAQMPGGDAGTFGLLLAAFGIGAVVSGFVAAPLQRRLSGRMLVASVTLVQGSGILALGLGSNLVIALGAAALAGGAWTLLITFFNVVVQLSVPRWVLGRSLAVYQATVAAGLSFGAALWGWLAAQTDVHTAIMVAGAAMILSLVLNIVAPIRDASHGDTESVPAASAPELAIAINGNSGPIIVELEYRIPASQARKFYHKARQVQRMRGRNGAYGASLSRDLSDPELWLERAHFPTWNDYLRARDRPTQAERDLIAELRGMHVGPDAPRLQRRLERPFGSVRWQADAPEDDGSGLVNNADPL